MSQRVVVAVLFTDLVGSTELSQRVGEEVSQDLWRTHLALLREALAAHRGEEVKKTGDGVMAVFVSPSDAVDCAVAIQQSVDRQNRRSSNPLGLRVGIHVGEVTPDEGDYYGTAVVVAERLCKRAGGGQILTTDVLRTMTGSHGTWVHTDVGSLELKGITEPVTAIDVIWEPLPEVGLPLPHALAPVESSPFVGREEELRQLRDAYKRVLDRKREVAFLVGEPGIGKSRLAAELAREAHAEGTVVLYGRCDETVTPFQPFVEALRHFVRTASLGELRDCAGAEAGELSHLIPELPHRLPHLPPPITPRNAEGGRLRLFDAVAGLLGRPARDRPMILILDDLHWADHATVQLLRFLLRIEAFPVLVLGAYRETDLDRSHPLSALLADLHRQHPFLRLRLHGLDGDDVAKAIEHRAGHNIGGAGRTLAENLCRTTDGNPFFIEQVIGNLIETGAIVDRDGVWRFDVRAEELGVPEGVQELISRRLSRLTETCNMLLLTAAVAGNEFHIELLEDVAGMPIDDLLDAFDEALAARFLLESPEKAGLYRFAHTLVREAIYDRLGETRRARLHAKIADALEARAADSGPGFDQIAHHLLASRPTGPARAVVGRKAADYARRAAAYAAQVFSHEEAASAYQTALRALEIVDDVAPAERCELLVGLGIAQTRARMIEDAMSTLGEAVELADEIPDALLYARVAVAFGEAVRTSSKRDSGIEIPVLESALDRLGIDDTPERADVLAHFAETLGPLGTAPERAAALAREGLAVATRMGDERRILWARDVLVMNLEAHSVSEQRSIAEDNVALAERLGDLHWQIRTRIRLIAAELAVGDVEQVDEELPVLVALAEQTRDPHQITQAQWWPVLRLLIEGEWSDVEARARDILEISDRYQIPDVAWPGLLFIMRRAQGRLAEIEPLVRAAARRSPIRWWKAGVALAYCEQGRGADAREVLDELLAKGLDDVPRDWMWPMLLGLLGQCAHELEDRDLASLVYDNLLPYREENIHAGGFYSGSAGVVLGLCATTAGRFDLAEEHFDTAAVLDQRSHAWPWLAITQLEHATMLETRRHTGDAECALALLEASLPRLEEFGLSRDTARAAGLRRRLAGSV